MYIIFQSGLRWRWSHCGVGGEIVWSQDYLTATSDSEETRPVYNIAKKVKGQEETIKRHIISIMIAIKGGI